MAILLSIAALFIAGNIKAQISDTPQDFNVNFDSQNGLMNINVVGFIYQNSVNYEIFETATLYYTTSVNGIDTKHTIGVFKGAGTVLNFFSLTFSPASNLIASTNIKYSASDNVSVIQLYVDNDVSNCKNIGIDINTNGAYSNSFNFNSNSNNSFTCVRNNPIIPMSPITINNPVYTFLPNGKTRINYSKSILNDIDIASRIMLINPVGAQIGAITPTALSGFQDIDNASSEITYHFTENAYGRVAINSGNVTIPGFAFPISATASYDTATQTTALTWTIDPASGSNYITNRFKIEQADNVNFNNATSMYVDYLPTQSSYSLLIDKNIAPHLYFRVSRDYPGFNWEAAKFADIDVQQLIKPINPATVSVGLQGGDTAVIVWGALKSAWLLNGSFVISKINKTSKSTTTIVLTKADYLLGKYLDNQVSVCNEYAYTLQILPPLYSALAIPAVVQVPGSVTPLDIGKVFNLKASKGYFPDRAELKWTAEGLFDKFIVKRAVYGSNNYIQLTTITGTGSGDYGTDDSKGTPGVYYTYSIVGMVLCNNTPKYSKDTLYAVGFRSPTGNIYGRVTFTNGQAVQNVGVRLQNTNTSLTGKSISMDGSPNSFLKLDSLNTLFADSALSFEAWIKPKDAAPINQVIFSSANQYEFGFDNAGALYFSNGTNKVTAAYQNLNQSFIHIAGIHTNDSLLIMLNDSVVGRIAAVTSAIIKTGQKIYLGTDGNSKYYKGLLDEVRVWNVAKTPARIAMDHTRLMTGNETGLVAYWRFDENINNQFYDLSHDGDDYNQNDGDMDALRVIRSSATPTPDQLSFKGLTDKTGNYMISGIPYTGNGITYSIIPILGTHQFDPTSVNRLISASSNEFTVDFKDISSFPVSGTVYYKNSTIPVSGVQFKIDGQYAQQSDGTLIETDVNGKFQISVPVGSHDVQGLKNGHVFLNGGRITDMYGKKLNYQGPVSERELRDSTTIRFIGRVAGGAIEEAYPLGHSLSKNNLGKTIAINMGLPTGAKYELFSGTVAHPDDTVIINHLLPSNITDPGKIHHTTIVYHKNSIEIFPDSVTGEFEADLIPEKFLANQVNVTGWPELLNNNPVALDFTSKFFINNSINKYADSTPTAQGYTYKNYIDTVGYNASYKFIRRVSPAVSMVQNNNGTEVPYFGDKTYNAVSLTGQKNVINLVDVTATGLSMYLFNKPVFSQNKSYTFVVKAFEAYPFYNSVVNGIGIIKQVNNKDVINIVPTQDGSVSILNYLKDGAVGVDTFSLNSKGQGIYQFTAGEPNFAAQGIKNLNVSIQFGGASNITWQWLGNPQLSAYVLGGKLSGQNFVTAGPDQLTMILRDPPGSASYSYAQKGTVITNSSTTSTSVDKEMDLDLILNLGVTTTTFLGLGAAVETSFEAVNDLGLGVHQEKHYTNDSTTERSTTLTTNFQTSGDPAFVGASADVFVGNSTNITYGLSNNIAIVKRIDLKATDIKLFEPDPSSDNLIIENTGINIGQTFGTLFAYPQVHIEKVLIPNLVSIINTILLPPTVSASDAQQMANTNKREVYISKLTIGDANFGKSNIDTIAFGNAAKLAVLRDGPSYTIYFPTGVDYVTDTISTLNQYINSWVQRMAENEKAKLEATLLQNYSFHAGSPVTFSREKSLSTSQESNFNFTISGSIMLTKGFAFNKFGITGSLKESLGSGGSITTVSSHSNTDIFGFSLGSNGSDDYFSVDVKEDKDKKFVFLTKGGVSGCPYEGATLTKYYQKGTVLDQPTMRIEVPKISVDKPVVTDVPETRKASYTLTLTNQSEAKIDGNFLLSYADDSTIKGATISIDGTPIGGGGRTIVVPYGQAIQKVVTISKGLVMDYNNIVLILKSGCQSDIADSVLLSAHFIPACSDIHIKTPADKWVVNTQSPVNTANKRYLPIILDQFDINTSSFDHIALQYKPAAGSAWITAMKFYSDTTKMNAAQGEKQLITNSQAINYSLVVDDASFNDQDYNIQAVSVCKLGVANFVTTESNMVSGLKDTYNPRLFGSPQPANGVLGINDNIRLNFNETIAAGLLTYTDFQVTGIRNGVQGNHTASVKLDGTSNYLATEFNKNLTGKSTTTEMWILADKPANGTIFSQGTTIQSLELALTADNYLQVTVGTKVIKSDKPVSYKQGEWAHTALVFNAMTQTVSAFYNYVEMISAVSVDAYTGNGVYQFGRSISKSGNYFSGKMHRAVIWSQPLTGTFLQINSLVQLSGAENNLLGFYPMDEGKGAICADKARGSNATLNGTWSTPAGKAIKLGGQDYVKLSTAMSPVTADMDYSMEMWFKGDASQSNAALASNGRGDNTDAGGSADNFFLGFENQLLTFQNNGFKIQARGNYLDNNWHHVALAVNRTSGVAQIYTDGVMNVSFDSKKIGGIAAAYTYLGARAWNDTNAITITSFDRYFTGSIDEYRVWNTYHNQTLIKKINNVRLNGNEIGLMSYYPFESYFTFQNNQQMGFTLKDLKTQNNPNVIVPDAVMVNALQSDEMAPIKDHGPVDNLKFDFVVNKDGLIINMLEPKQAIDKTIITIVAKNVKDLNGNEIISPISWTAYIDQNQLKWSDNLLNLSKATNAPMQFETYVVNSGGNIQNFRLSNMPGWLTADIKSGTVGPLGKQKITFTVNTGLNIGTYDEVIFMTNDNDVAEALTLNLVVKGKKPTWVVNPADYSLSMNLYGKLRIYNLFSTDKEDMLGAFVNGKCVGVTTNTYNAASDLWFTYLTIYSNPGQVGNIVFRIWQASSGKTFQATSSTAVNFGIDSVKATIRNPIIFDGGDNVYQEIVLNKGWNWTSFNVANKAVSIDDALMNGTWAAGDIIKNQTINFNQYSVNNLSWIGTLPGINYTSLFMLRTDNAQNLSISGSPVDVTTTAIPVKPNWNYISYLPQINMSLRDGLAGYTAQDEEVIKSQDAFAMYDTRLGWVGNLTFLEPGKGYMLYRNQAQDTSFHYPLVKRFFRFATLENHVSGGSITSTASPVPANRIFAENMTVTAAIGKGFSLQADDWVLAYSGGEVRAKAHILTSQASKPTNLFFTISGDKEQAVYFVVERNGVEVAQAQTVINYASNTQLGTINKPLLLNFSEAAGDFITAYPNPFSQKIMISVNVPASGTALHSVQVAVYNSLGQAITQLPEAIVNKGVYQTSWNGKNAGGVNCNPGVYVIQVTIDGNTQIQKVIKN